MPRSQRLLRSADQQTGLKALNNTARNYYHAEDDDYIIADLDVPAKEIVKTYKKLPTRQSTRGRRGPNCTKKKDVPILPLIEELIPKFKDGNESSQVNAEDDRSFNELHRPESQLPFPILTEAQIKKEIIETDSESSSDSSSSDGETENSSVSGSSEGESDSDSSSSTSSEENDQKPELISFPIVKVIEGLTEAPQIIEPLTVLPYKGKKRGPKRKKPIKIRDPNKPIRKSPGTPWDPIPCPHCPKTFRYISQLRQHSTAHSKERPFYCDECGKSFTRNCFLEEHRACHLGIGRKDNKDFSCSYCGKKFPNSTELKLHVRTHTGEKPFSCDLCGRSFSVARTLKIHLRRHAGEKPFKCTECDKAFTVKLELQRHMQRVHNHAGENGSYKRVQCEECGRKFSHVGILKDHLLIHQGIKPFQCPFCDVSFRQANHLDHHIRVHKWKS